MESERDMQEREEQRAGVEQTSLSILENHKRSVLTATRIICRLVAKFHDHAACKMSTSVKG